MFWCIVALLSIRTCWISTWLYFFSQSLVIGSFFFLSVFFFLVFSSDILSSSTGLLVHKADVIYPLTPLSTYLVVFWPIVFIISSCSTDLVLVCLYLMSVSVVRYLSCVQRCSGLQFKKPFSSPFYLCSNIIISVHDKNQYTHKVCMDRFKNNLFCLKQGTKFKLKHAVFIFHYITGCPPAPCVHLYPCTVNAHNALLYKYAR